MTKDIFRAREEAEEAAYFHQQDEKLIAKLRERAAFAEIAGALAEKLVVDNPALLKRIMQLGITLETGAAFLVLPLIQVAWAEGKVTRRERDALVSVVAERGIKPGTADHAQVLKWLEQRPSDELFNASLEALRIGIAVLPAQEAPMRIQRILAACRTIAEASGGVPKALLLQSGISREEQTVIDFIEASLSLKPQT